MISSFPFLLKEGSATAYVGIAIEVVGEDRLLLVEVDKLVTSPELDAVDVKLFDATSVYAVFEVSDKPEDVELAFIGRTD